MFDNLIFISILYTQEMFSCSYVVGNSSVAHDIMHGHCSI
jgi:hypothetical protein